MGTEDNTIKFLDVIVKIPALKVDRNSFLIKAFPFEDPNRLLSDGPIKCLGKDYVDKHAAKIIQQVTVKSSTMSFAAGLPGGLAMAATIPADTAQFYMMALRLAQELGYLYDKEDLWNDIDSVKSRETLLLYLGVMFGVSGTGAVLRVVSAQMSKQALKKIPQKTLTKTIYYPVIKKVSQFIGVKLTKSTFAKGVSKFIPVIGGVISGGMTYASMIPMGKRLQSELSKGVNYDQTAYNQDLKDLNIVDADFTEVDDLENHFQNKNQNSNSAADELMKFKNLLDAGAISKEEYDEYKNRILHMSV